jgi:hypothetical protein
MQNEHHDELDTAITYKCIGLFVLPRLPSTPNHDLKRIIVDQLKEEEEDSLETLSRNKLYDKRYENRAKTLIDHHHCRKRDSPTSVRERCDIFTDPSLKTQVPYALQQLGFATIKLHMVVLKELEQERSKSQRLASRRKGIEGPRRLDIKPPANYTPPLRKQKIMMD